VITHASAEYTPENSGLIPSVRLGINGDHFAYTILLPAPVEIRYSYLQAARHVPGRAGQHSEHDPGRAIRVKR
jgi:hypothetical protein